ncbi:hypothetical protein DLAC_11173 [Tieghemostelium lacteum]|uniref:Uncharacterized protein n=1 Tax=Tieghemostelium lacteum TaxID=361077 RepID=A0A151Z3C4_TIELA|nr:hypothetical protein DLAC_11173 [Tieghemostelium lacteum]|eukprot:KYQ88463.1 hypothetical protein DLAC_11173 [Tieghemostelium lacteum]
MMIHKIIQSKSSLLVNTSNGIYKSLQRQYLSNNSQYQNNNYDIMSLTHHNNSIENTYKILQDIITNGKNKSSQLRISYFNQERDKCDIKGIKVLGYVDHYQSQHEYPWIVVTGGSDRQWSSVNLSLYIATLLAHNPLQKYDVLIFPIQSPSLFSHKEEDSSITALLEASMNQQPNNILSSFSSNFLTSSSSNSNNSNNNKHSLHQYSNFSLYSSTNNGMGTDLSELNYAKPVNSNKNLVLNDWLKKSKRPFQHLELNLQNKNKPTIQLDPNVHNNKKPSRIQIQYFNNTESNVNTKPNQRNYILELKNIPNHLNNDKLFNISKDISRDLKIFENFKFFNNSNKFNKKSI